MLDTDVVSYIFDQDNTAVLTTGSGLKGVALSSPSRPWKRVGTERTQMAGAIEARTDSRAMVGDSTKSFGASVRLVEICAQLRSKRRNAAGREIQSGDIFGLRRPPFCWTAILHVP